MGLFNKKKRKASKFKFLRTTKTLWEEFDEEVAQHTRKKGQEFVKDCPEFHEGFVNDIADLITKGEEAIYNLPELREDVLNAYSTQYITDIDKANRKQLAQRKFLKEFAESDVFKTMKTSMDATEAIDQVLAFLQQAKENKDNQQGGKQDPNGDQQQQGQGQGEQQNDNTGQGSAEGLEELLDQAKDLVDSMSNEADFETMQGFNEEDSKEQKEQDRQQQQNLVAGKGTANPKDLKQFLGKMMELHKAIYRKKNKAQIFDLARKLKLMAKHSKGWDFEPDDVAEEYRIRNMRHYGQVTKTIPSHLAAEDDLFYSRYAKKQLLVQERVTRKDKTQILHILLDCSGSMGWCDDPEQTVPTYIPASAIAISFLRSTIDNGDKFLLRLFDSRPKTLFKVEDKKEAGAAIFQCVHNGYSGGGTNIHSAISTGIDDIIQFRASHDNEDFGKAEILVITDGGDRIDTNVLKEKLRLSDVKLNSVVIGRNDGLKEISEKFFNTSPVSMSKDAGNVIQKLVAVDEKEEAQRYAKTR